MAAGGRSYPRGQAEDLAAKVCGVATRTPTSSDVARAAADAAARAGVRIELLGAPETADDLADLFVEIWDTSHRYAPMSPDLLCALSFTGQYVVLAHDLRLAQRPAIAASLGFLGRADGGPLHSHITGVAGGAGPRRRLRDQAAPARVGAGRTASTTITWTFDPLVRRNAYFNLAKLGARRREYLATSTARWATA